LHRPHDRPDPGEASSPDAGDRPAAHPGPPRDAAASPCAAVALFDAIQGGELAVIELEPGISSIRS
jgi:hypothetical protein